MIFLGKLICKGVVGMKLTQILVKIQTCQKKKIVTCNNNGMTQGESTELMCFKLCIKYDFSDDSFLTPFV